MSESLLKKEFKEQDIQRIRNLVQKKYGASTQTLVGYNINHEVHKEGDVWQEGNKTWTIEDGIKISVSKLQKARDLAMIPLACPRCGKALTTRWDKKMYPLYHMCFDCVVKFEDDLKRAGLYRTYEQEIIKGNIEGFVSELRARISDLKQSREVGVSTGEGEAEAWGGLSDELLHSLEEWGDILQEKANNL